MITLADLARLAAEHPDDLDLPVAPLRVGDRVLDTDARPAVMGIVNLSRDSSYRESIATTPASAVRRGKVLAAQGADIVDLGAESTNSTASRVEDRDQVATLVPVIEELADAGVAVSIESYSAPVVRAGLQAGAQVVNLTGSDDDDAMFDLAAEHDAALVLCHILGDHARQLHATGIDADPLPAMLAQFETRVATARARGVTRIVVDPGLGFVFGATRLDQQTRARHQSMVLLNSFRLRRLGLPICHAMPHAFDVFEEQFRTAEGFFTVLALLGGTGVFRTHEVPRVVAVLDAMRTLDAHPPSAPA